MKDLESIFSAALLKANPVERGAYLDGACHGDEALRQRVEELLAAQGVAGSFLGGPTVDVGAPTRPGEGAGTRIGPYKLLQEIGEGGFGVVYMAEQQEPVRRRVALKIIKLGMDTKQVIARFEAERQALAMMEHPNIAKVFDSGATETGRPYFVMELVRGIPLTEYCDQNNLTTRERLELFVPVCRAIQHAHQKGIIHRDIKPTNVMVTLHDGRPVPKVIDFGIAKATNHRLTELTVFTEFRQFIGTPEYMSPEQAEMSGLDIDTRSDIYSLGVLLYELLTGTTPFDTKKLRAAGYAEMTRLIRETEPPAPSTRLSMLGEDADDVARHRKMEVSMLQRLLRGDLDWIVMKSLDKGRTRRYETASDLVADIRRHLSYEPVLASPSSSLYKFQKFVRRNRTIVFAGSLVALALVAGLTLAILGLLEASREREIVAQERDAVREAKEIAARERDAAREANEIASRERDAAQEANARYEETIESLKQTLRAVEPERVAALNAGAQGVLSMARQVVTEATPMPVSFGDYAELDAFRGANWGRLAEAIDRMRETMLEALDDLERGVSLDAEQQKIIQSENNKLVRLASGVMGKIPTAAPGNGEYTHPIILVNLRAALLERAGVPLSADQKSRITAIGNAFELELSQRRSSYDANVIVRKRVLDELELKSQCVEQVEGILTKAQRKLLIDRRNHNRLQVDPLSPVLMLIMNARALKLRSAEAVRSEFPARIASGYDLSAKQVESLDGAFDIWYREVLPILETDESRFLTLRQCLVAGRANAKLFDAILRLEDLDEKTRKKLRRDYEWPVPRVVGKNIEELRQSIEELKESAGPKDQRVAEELDALALLFEEQKNLLEGIPVLIEAIEIYRAALGESWNANPLRYRLRDLIWPAAIDPARPPEEYTQGKTAVEVVLSLKPDSEASLKTLGAFQYYDKARKTLTRADALNSERHGRSVPSDLAFLAMTHVKLGDREAARATLKRLRGLMQSGKHSRDSISQQLRSEAESVFEEATSFSTESEAETED